MQGKRVCPNCGELYASDLEKCPLCGAPAQVLEQGSAGKRSSDGERRKRKSKEKAARRREEGTARAESNSKNSPPESEAFRRREDEHMKKEFDRQPPETGAANHPGYAPQRRTDATPTAAQNGRRPAVHEVYVKRDRTRAPRFLLWLSFLILLATLLVGTAYLLDRQNVVHIPIFDTLRERSAQKAANAAAKPTEPQPGGETGNATAPATSAPNESEPGVSTEPQPGGETGNATAPGTSAPNESEPGVSTEAETDDPWSGKKSCTALSLNKQEMKMTFRNDVEKLDAIVEPKDTTDERTFTSSDENVVKVSGIGVVTAVNEGTAVITVTCGKHTAECKVVCEFSTENTEPEPSLDVDELVLNNPDMTFFGPNEFFLLEVTNVPFGTKVEWTSLDPTIATVDDSGRVVAVSKGTTKVVAKIGELKTECWVRCNFKEDTPSE